MPKVLVIDDSTFFRQFVRGFLEEAGFQVEDFLPLSALEVMERARAYAPDLVLTDYNMPHVDGMAVAGMIRRYSSTTPLLVLTATRDAEREIKLQRFAPLHILHKPAKGEDIVKAVKKVLGAD